MDPDRPLAGRKRKNSPTDDSSSCCSGSTAMETPIKHTVIDLAGSDDSESVTMDDSGNDADDRVDSISPAKLEWKIIHNPSGARIIDLDYLLEKDISWSSEAMHMVFVLPDLIGMESDSQALLHSAERGEVIAAIFRHLQLFNLLNTDSSIPPILFRGKEIHIVCRDYIMAQTFLDRHPRYKGNRLWMKSKAFASDNCEVQLFSEVTLPHDKTIEKALDEYVNELKNIFDVANLIALAQDYHVIINGSSHCYFAGKLVIFAGRKKGAEEVELPKFGGVRPKRVV